MKSRHSTEQPGARVQRKRVGPFGAVTSVYRHQHQFFAGVRQDFREAKNPNPDKLNVLKLGFGVIGLGFTGLGMFALYEAAEHEAAIVREFSFSDEYSLEEIAAAAGNLALGIVVAPSAIYLGGELLLTASVFAKQQEIAERIGPKGQR